MNKYKDIKAARFNPLLHYLIHGKQEGRIKSSDVKTDIRRGRLPHRRQLPTVLIASHEASRTGAPIVGLNLARYLVGRVNVICWLGRGGSMLEQFVESSSFVVVSDFDEAEAHIRVDDLLGRTAIDFAIINSVECTPVLGPLSAHKIPIVSLNHEFSEYTRPVGKISRMLALSQVVVVPSEIVKASVLDELGICAPTEPNHVAVRNQGRSILRSEPSAKNDYSVKDICAACGIEEGSATPVVLGAGWVQPRKGVDLFMDVARRTIQDHGVDCRFVWVGGNFNKNDLAYGVYLWDQLRRMDLEDNVFILDEQSNLDALFSVSSAFLLTSRLDPQPNVALDALASGIPVVCFSNAAGTAELSSLAPDLVQVARYLDTVDAASKLANVLSTRANSRSVTSAQNRSALNRALDFGNYVQDLLGYAELAKTKRATINSVARDPQVIHEFDPTFFLSAMKGREFLLNDYHAQSAGAKQWAVEDYLVLAANGIFPGKPRPGVNNAADAVHSSSNLVSPSTHELASKLKGRSNDHRVVTVNACTRAASTRPLSSLIHIHAFYEDMVSGFIQRLTEIGATSDLVVTTDEDEKARQIEYACQPYRGGKVQTMVVSNIGRDIGPMLQLTKTMDIFKYDLLAHVHTKRSVALGGETGIKWMEFLLEHLLGPQGSFDVIMAEFERESRLGLVFPEDANNVGWTKNKALAIDLAERLDVNGAVPSQPEFPVGTMFWARPLALKQLFDAASVLIHELPSEPLRYDGTMLHAIERLLPSICISAGYSWATVHIPGVTR